MTISCKPGRSLIGAVTAKSSGAQQPVSRPIRFAAGDLGGVSRPWRDNVRGRREDLRGPGPPRRLRDDKALLERGLEVGDPGLEPGTSSLSEKRSNRLS